MPDFQLHHAFAVDSPEHPSCDVQGEVANHQTEYELQIRSLVFQRVVIHLMPGQRQQQQPSEEDSHGGEDAQQVEDLSHSGLGALTEDGHPLSPDVVPLAAPVGGAPHFSPVQNVSQDTDMVGHILLATTDTDVLAGNIFYGLS